MEQSNETTENQIQKDDLIDRAKNLEKLASSLYNKLKTSNLPKTDNKDNDNEEKNTEESKINDNKNDTDLDLNNNEEDIRNSDSEERIKNGDEIKEINEKLDKILEIVKNNGYERIENMLKEVLTKLENLKKVDLSDEALDQISDKIKKIYDSSKMELMEKLDKIIANTENYSSKLDKLSDEVDTISEKIDTMSEKIKELMESGGVKVVDVIKLIKEIYQGIDDIKKLLNKCDEESLDRAIEIVDEINGKIDNYLKEIEKELSS
ncbi:conserved hypothetical protein [Methanocaldococcus vulcanius M7]|uniref:Uncharacterized protein n=1 Tax=Methanocaldococcus vulcanius (strain ATCC 700851 / DSM 12094 / M7) TaxID=579137 RepID=C9RIE3_METVM|nr:hypothetical protein [Methanocaldococcus vulcanius]ACX73345.1 conserved hypothetical protein [Methanocaldococcus vulcanius M7]